MQINIDLPFIFRLWISKADCQNAVLKAFQSSKVTNPEISVVFTGNRKITQLNSLYRKLNRPTDVLSFQSMETTKSGTYVGDIIISVPKAIEQARKHRHSVNAEIILLIVHGALHLQGYDDEEPVSKAKMWKKQAQVLAQLGIESSSLNI